MSEELIIMQCSPTLAGMKTGSIFNCPFFSKKILWNEIRHLNSLLSKKGLRIIPLAAESRKALIFIYRPDRLEKDIIREESVSILKECGYCRFTTQDCIARLKERLSEGNGFPHEIGLFLGYPPEDVRGFIQNKALGHKVTGYWKVYGDEKKALETFSKYRKCTRVYTKKQAEGVSIEQLAVAG